MLSFPIPVRFPDGHTELWEATNVQEQGKTIVIRDPEEEFQ